MRKNFFVKLLRYMKNVYHIDYVLRCLTEKGFSKYKIPQVILITLLAFQIRIKSMNELEFLLKETEFRSLFPINTSLPKSYTVIDALKFVRIAGL